MASIRDSPISGHGPDTFRLVFKRFSPREYVTDSGWTQVADNSHNYPLQIASGLGIPGALLLYGALSYSLLRSAGAAFARERPPQSVLLAGFWAASLGYILHLMFGISVVSSTTLLWVSLAVLLGTRVRERTIKAPPWGRPVSIVVVIAAVVGIAASAMIPLADHQFAKAHAGPTIEARLESAQRAIQLNPLNVAYRSQPGHLQLESAGSWLMQANADIDSGRDASISVQAALLAARRAIDAYEAAIEFAPAESENYLNLAIAANQAGQIEPSHYSKAIDVVNQGLEVDPHNPGMRVEAARAHFYLGRATQAIALAEEAAAIDPRFVVPHQLLGEIWAAQGKRDQALTEYRRALELDPEDPYIRLAIEQAIRELTQNE